MKHKVLVISSSFPRFKDDINGNFVFELASRLSASFEIHVLAPAYKGAATKEIIDNITVHRHKQFLWHIELAYGIGIYENLKRRKWKFITLPFYFLFLITAIRRVVKKEKITICHAHWLIPNALMAVLCKKLFFLKFKTLATIHGSDFWGFNNKWGNVLKRYTLSNIDTLTVVSHIIKEKVLEIGYKKEVFVYPMGIDTQMFSPDKEDPAILKKYNVTGYFLLFVGIVVEQKGIRHLIEAMPLILEKCPGTKLLVVGDGNLKKEMINLTELLGINENIIFTGALPHHELPPLFATADVFVLPSFSEGWPVVVMEALSSGIPVVVSDLEIFINHSDKANLFEIVKAGDKANIAQGITKTLNSSHIINKSVLRKYAVGHFDWNVILYNYSTLLNILAK